MQATLKGAKANLVVAARADGPCPQTASGQVDHASLMLIDDDSDLHFSLRSASRALGCSLGICTEARSALVQIAEAKPDLVMVDLRMADFDGVVWSYAGLNVCRVLRRHFGQAFRIVIITDSDCPALVYPCLAAGADDFFVRSEALPRLRKRLERWLDPASIKGMAASAAP